jgi:hypothetical protein
MSVATQKWKCIVQFLCNGFVPYDKLEPATVKTENVPQSFQQLDSEFKMNNPCWIFLEMWDQMKIYNVSSWVFFWDKVLPLGNQKSPVWLIQRTFVN